ncbi:MAG: DegT/DnrJ/EryC1/StrS family aminotransferase [Pseudobutyrivibrio ruminis]|uniref:DegT/DnrJ/EryC1/StrS family aminotransferase n=1 Tax=Pseudobutyrivibrio ruminis TaxID=46206 RepID=UPI0026F1AEF2|nr:DegT/DnrJ/EryC1/StrS family aminotransferase [Pseudobutyrivibrio ruminis]MBE5913517.1 DegT/DnrJ/EryC1/StrS family aminotransferase [Pseudobutyrivibrio ruminis]
MDIQLFKAKYEVDECLNEIRECLEVGWTGMGFKTVKFEEAWKKYTGLPYAHYLNSSTMGLYMAVDILKEEYGWEDGDEIITTPITFISTNHAIAKSNMKAVFADIDETMCLNPKSVREHITNKTKAIMYVGLGGNVGNYSEIVEICKEHNLKFILDAAHMTGTRYNGKIPGKEADVVVYSFQAVKNLPTADSGMICFKEGKLDEIVRKKAWLGINKDTYARTQNMGNYKWRYDVEYLGEKGHGNSVMASIGLVQLKYVDRDNSYRRTICNWYRERLEPYADKIKFVRIEDGCESSCHLFQILVDDRDALIVALNQAGISPGVHYIANTNYKMYDYAKGTCPYAEYVSEHTLSLPLNLYLSRSDVDYICDEVIKFIEN